MLNGAQGEAVATVVAVLRVDTATVEVQVASISRINHSGRPVVAVRAEVVQRRTIVVATSRKK